MVSIYVGWFTVAYPPQAVVMLFLNGPMGFISSFVLVINQAATIYGIVAKLFFIKSAHKTLFDTV